MIWRPLPIAPILGAMWKNALLTLAMLAGSARCRAEPLQIFTDDSPPVTVSRSGAPAGWAVEVVREIERRVGETAEIRLVPWARAYRAGLHEPNVALFATMWTEERAPLFRWVGPLQTLHMSFYGRARDGIEITSTDDARRFKSIGVTRQFAVDEELTRLGFANLDRVERPSQMIEKLLAGRNEVFASDEGFVSPAVLGALNVAADAIVKKYEFKTTQTYIAFSIGTPPETAQAWQTALDEMRADGTFDRLYGKN